MMPQLPFAEMVWLIAGLGLGISLSMVFLALVLEADRRRLRRQLRPVALAALVTDRLPERPVPRGEAPKPPGTAPKPRRVVADPSTGGEPQRAKPEPKAVKPSPAPAVFAAEAEAGVKPEPESEVAALEGEPTAAADLPAGAAPPGGTPQPPVTEPPAKPLSVEEVFAQAFKAAELTKSPTVPGVGNGAVAPADKERPAPSRA